MFMQPFNVEADFETYYDEKEGEENNIEGKSTILLGKIKPYSFALQLNCLYDINLNTVMGYTGKNAVEKFIEALTSVANDVKEIKAGKNPLSNEISSQRDIEYPPCIICNKTIRTELNAHKYRYYCKKTVILLGFAHKKCSKENKSFKEFTVLMHNGSGFDFKLIIASLAEYFYDCDLKVLGESTKKLSSISIKNFNKTGITAGFIDSKKHLNESLDCLKNSLSNNFHNKNYYTKINVMNH